MTNKRHLDAILAEHDICHPTRITSFQVTDVTASLTVSGYPWWDPDLPKSDAAELHICFQNLSELEYQSWLFDNDGFDEALEDLFVQKIINLPWKTGPRAEVFVYAPLPDALGFLAGLETVYRTLGNADELTRLIEKFQGLDKFRKHTASDVYNLGIYSGPILDWVTQELSRLGIRFNTIDAAYNAQVLDNWNRRYLVTFSGFRSISDAPVATWECAT